jgi:glycosyltransferase involved in cell wall biosynthesis
MDERIIKIVVDGLSSRAGGGRTYLQQLLAKDAPGWAEVHAVVPAGLEFKRLGRGMNLVIVKDRISRPVLRSAWEHTFLPLLLRRTRADVLFCPGGSIPALVGVGRLRVTMSRNMLPFDRRERARYKSGYIKVRIAILERLLMRSMITADLVIFVSQHAERVITESARGSIGRSVVIPHGVGEVFRSAPQSPSLDWLPAQDYVLYVSNFEPYKHQVSVVRAFAILKTGRHAETKLLLVGPASSPSYTSAVHHEIRRLGLESDVIVRASLPQHELAGVYIRARAGVFASTCENCPNILLEAMAAGLPLVVSDRPPMPEFAKEAVLYADPENPVELADQLGKLLDSSALSADFAQRATEASRLFDWSSTAYRTWQTILDVWSETSQ